MDWLREEIHQRGASVAYEGSTEDLVENALKLLKNLVAKVRGIYICFCLVTFDTRVLVKVIEPIEVSRYI